MKIIYNIKSKRKYATPTIKLIEVEAEGLLQDSATSTGDNMPGDGDNDDILEYEP